MLYFNDYDSNNIIFRTLLRGFGVLGSVDFLVSGFLGMGSGFLGIFSFVDFEIFVSVFGVLEFFF